MITAIAGCGGQDPTSLAEPAGGLATTASASSAAPQPETTTGPAGPDLSAPTSPCNGFVPMYIGQGLTTSLPAGSVATGGESTADAVPVHAGWASFFVVDGVRVTIGRRLGTSAVPEADFSQRVDDGVVTYVAGGDQPLRECLLEMTTYDRALDEKDE